MSKPKTLDRSKPFGVVVGDARMQYSQVIDGIRYGFDHNDELSYDQSNDPDNPPPKPEKPWETNLPGQFREKKMDRNRPYAIVKGAGLPYVYLQDHLGFDAQGNAVYADPGHWGVPAPPEPKKAEAPSNEVAPEEESVDIGEEPEEGFIYPLEYLRSLTQQQLKSLWFRHDLGQWRGTRGKPATVKAIEVLSQMRSEYGDDIPAASTGTD